MNRHSIFILIALMVGLLSQDACSQSTIDCLEEQPAEDSFVYKRCSAHAQFTKPSNTVIPLLNPSAKRASTIDLVQSGRINITAPLFRFLVGKPGHFEFPVTLQTGLSTDYLYNSSNQDPLLIGLVNPVTGILGIINDGQYALLKKWQQSPISLHIHYQAGVRILSLYDQYRINNEKVINILSLVGLNLSSTIWEKGNPSVAGIIWIGFRLTYSSTAAGILDRLSVLPIDNKIYANSWSMGIEINEKISTRICSYHFFNNGHRSSINDPYIQASIRYTL